jgi:hypothetical protein
VDFVAVFEQIFIKCNFYVYNGLLRRGSYFHGKLKFTDISWIIMQVSVDCDFVRCPSFKQGLMLSPLLRFSAQKMRSTWDMKPCIVSYAKHICENVCPKTNNMLQTSSEKSKFYVVQFL